MDISVITPSYNMLDYLKCCSASVSDQKGAEFEHIVIDGDSSDGTADWLREQRTINYLIEKDKGMYDALNKGLKIAKGEIIAYLNCDEQYLPGTLATVKQYFQEHPTVDILFGDFLVTDNSGRLICFQKTSAPKRSLLLATHLYSFTCAMFFRRRIIDDGIVFNTDYRCISDYLFVLDVLYKKYKAGHIRRYMSVFTDSGNNLSGTELSRRELEEFKTRLGRHTAALWPGFRELLGVIRIAEKVIRGCYTENLPLRYEIYEKGKMKERDKRSETQLKPFWSKANLKYQGFLRLIYSRGKTTPVE